MPGLATARRSRRGSLARSPPGVRAAGASPTVHGRAGRLRRRSRLAPLPRRGTAYLCDFQAGATLMRAYLRRMWVRQGLSADRTAAPEGGPSEPEGLVLVVGQGGVVLQGSNGCQVGFLLRHVLLLCPCPDPNDRNWTQLGPAQSHPSTPLEARSSD
jgi:hypothetical protein